MIISDRPHRVFIVEKQLLFGRAMSHALSSDPDVKVIGLAARFDSANFDKDQPVIVIVDIDSEDIDEVVTFFKPAFPNVRICALSVHTQPELLQHCLSSGADAYIVKDSSLHELITAIKTLASGSSYADPRVAALLLRRRNPANRLTASQLSPRETDILRLIGQGLSNRDIGRRLILSEKTVKNHVSHIFSKLNFTARSQAAVHAIRTGLV